MNEKKEKFQPKFGFSPKLLKVSHFDFSSETSLHDMTQISNN
jgi:hypothetical protein